MKTTTINLYSFEELSEKAQKKALEELQDINTDYNWWEFTYDDFQQMAENFGIDVDLKKTYFSHSYSQGDGSSFTATVDVVKLVECIKTEGWKAYAPKENLSFYDVTPNIERVCKLIANGHIDLTCSIYPINRESNVETHFEYYFEKERWRVIETLVELEKLVTDTVKTLNRWFFRNLVKECEYLTSKEAIIETIHANEYLFYDNGKLIRREHYPTENA